MSGYVLGADAALELGEIWDYSATDNIAAADRWIAKLFDAFDALAEMPGMGHARETSALIGSGSGRSACISSSSEPRRP